MRFVMIVIKRLITFIVSSLFLVVLAGCQSTGSQFIVNNNPAIDLLSDHQFPGHQQIPVETQEQIFALNDEMKRLIKNKIKPERSPQKRAIQLIKHIFEDENVGLAYQSNANLIASQAYQNGKANCMSLTIMAYALATEAGLNVRFQDVKVPEYWVRNGQYNMLTGHVNIVLTDVKESGTSVVWGATSLEIDFDPFVKKKNFPKQKISKSTAVAMFYNNIGAHALANNNYNKAYAYLKAALKTAPDYAPSWGNLGILYKFNQQLAHAEQAYNKAIILDPNALNALNNLSLLLTAKGDFDKARRIDSAILKRRIRNPYYHALLADEAFYAGDPIKAIKHYKRAIRLDDRVHEFYFGLAKIHSARGDFDSAKYAMQKAISKNKIQSIDRQYLAKLSILNQQ